MFRITDREFMFDDYGKESYLKNWPMLYILENGQQAYIGESTNVMGRMAQHKANENKRIFDNVHLIYSDKFNQSVTFDYESKLIQLFASDEQYSITNGNAGIADKSYFNKNYYDEEFSALWERLRNKKLAKHTIDEIVNSDLFKFSPYKELNESQREAVEEILVSIKTNCEQPIMVYGMPGSGKTIVAIFLFKILKDDENYKDKSIGLVVPQTSLRKTLKNLFKHIHGLKASDVIGPSDVVKKNYDILLVDEAHRLHQRKNIPNMGSHDANNRRLGLTLNSDELDWILMQTKCPILFYDKHQVVGPSGISYELIQKKLNKDVDKRMITYYTLTTQMRVKGGNGYIDYIERLLNNKVEERKEFSNYDFKIVDSFDRFNNFLIENENKHSLSRMVAGYSWPWVSKKDKSKKDICIEGISKMWNNRTENWVHCETALDEVGCIHSIQGYDLNYAFVIMGNDIKFDKSSQSIVVEKNSYYDRNGKATATGEELLEYIKNIYYVLMTRGIRGTYLYVCDPELREYFKQYVDEI